MYLRRVSQTNIALGSDVTLSFVTDIPDIKINELFAKLWKYIYTFERKFSRFIPMSELTILNRSAGIKNKIGADLKDILIESKSFGIETKGLYNPFITPALQLAGYKKSALSGYENDIQIDYTDRKVVDVDKLEIGDDWAQIPYKTAVDLGGIGKGYLADKIGKILNTYNIVGCWVSFGGDIFTSGLDENKNRILVDIQSSNDLNFTTDFIIECPTGDFAIATSGSIKRNEQKDLKDWHHIIDPATLKPAMTDIRLATVCSDTTTRADVMASCAVILGSRKAPAFLKKHGIESALLQCIDENGVQFNKVFGPHIKKIKNYKPREFAVNA